MKSSQFREWLEVVGVFGVIASLVFLGMELRQSQKIAIADAYQQRSALLLQVQTTQYSPEQLSQVVHKELTGQSLSAFEEHILTYGWYPWFTYWENVHYQYELGMVTEEQWQSSRNTMRFMTDLPHFESWWARERERLRATFAAEMDEVLKEEQAKR